MHKTLYNISRGGGGKCPLLPMPAGAHATTEQRTLQDFTHTQCILTAKRIFYSRY